VASGSHVWNRQNDVPFRHRRSAGHHHSFRSRHHTLSRNRCRNRNRNRNRTQWFYLDSVEVVEDAE
jgi:hypothetical protein